MRIGRLCMVFLALSALSGAASFSGGGGLNGVFDIWVSQTFEPAPHAPFHDCLTLSGNQICSDICGVCGPLSIRQTNHRGRVIHWSAENPCDGVNLVYFGSMVDGPGGRVVAATMVGQASGASFGMGGVENSSCTLTTGTANADGTSVPANPYRGEGTASSPSAQWERPERSGVSRSR